MQAPWILIPLNLLLIALLFWLNHRRRKRRTANPWGKVPYAQQAHFLSPAERQFYFALRQAVGEEVAICPKPAIRELLVVTREAGGNSQMYFNWISQKHVDFVLCNQNSMEVLCAVELDDASHQQKDRIQRDQFMDKAFAKARLPLFHIKCKAIYRPDDFSPILGLLKEGAFDTPPDVLPHTPPVCPKCGGAMILRIAKKGIYAGQSFYGCCNYPKCNGTLNGDS